MAEDRQRLDYSTCEIAAQEPQRSAMVTMIVGIVASVIALDMIRYGLSIAFAADMESKGEAMVAKSLNTVALQMSIAIVGGLAGIPAMIRAISSKGGWRSPRLLISISTPPLCFIATALFVRYRIFFYL